uniref:Uncharacterized protein n=1 Tax=Myoviridae sp. ctGrV43 TaxID=2825075 RepID=A0A8S5UEZ3_9CAUD|nr:MAG TPA: hypothetical protein [Myoviridae sp. ctGrV43]
MAYNHLLYKLFNLIINYIIYFSRRLKFTIYIYNVII